MPTCSFGASLPDRGASLRSPPQVSRFLIGAGSSAIPSLPQPSLTVWPIIPRRSGSEAVPVGAKDSPRRAPSFQTSQENCKLVAGSLFFQLTSTRPCGRGTAASPPSARRGIQQTEKNLKEVSVAGYGERSPVRGIRRRGIFFGEHAQAEDPSAVTDVGQRRTIVPICFFKGQSCGMIGAKRQRRPWAPRGKTKIYGAGIPCAAARGVACAGPERR